MVGEGEADVVVTVIVDGDGLRGGDEEESGKKKEKGCAITAGYRCMHGYE